MALTRITSSVIKDSTITEGKFDTQYLNATGSPDTGQQPITLESDLNIRVGQGPTFFSASNNLLSLTAATGNVDACTISLGGLTCLLYTSPSPRDRPLSRMPSSA